MKFRKIPVVIEAVKWTGDRDVINDFIGLKDNPEDSLHSFDDKGTLLIKTLESGHGMHTATLGDWIIKGVKGEFYPCKPDVFEMTYEKENTPKLKLTYQAALKNGDIVKLTSEMVAIIAQRLQEGISDATNMFFIFSDEDSDRLALMIKLDQIICIESLKTPTYE